MCSKLPDACLPEWSRAQVVPWAVQDLQIKRAKLERDLQVEHPLVWFRNMMARTCSFDGNMEVVEIFESPMAMKCTHPKKVEAF
jgi:hypothetical protein